MTYDALMMIWVSGGSAKLICINIQYLKQVTAMNRF